MAETTAIEIYRGETALLDFAMTPPTDIDGWTLKFTVSKRPNALAKIIETAACTIVSAAVGTYQFALVAADTEDAEPAVYFWDTWRTNAGSERLLGSGTFTILPDARLPGAP